MLATPNMPHQGQSDQSPVIKTRDLIKTVKTDGGKLIKKNCKTKMVLPYTNKKAK
jgi:hypothetical protein